jgi:hypothetical protein
MRDFSNARPEITEEAEFIASSELFRSADNAVTKQIIGAAIEAPEGGEQDTADHLDLPPRESPRLRVSAMKRSPR